jgi:hypothetical protein
MKNLFNTLCAKARTEDIPKVNIADKTIALIESNELQMQWFWNKPLMWVAALSSAIAVPVVIMAILLHNIWAEPLYEISQVISWAI